MQYKVVFPAVFFFFLISQLELAALCPFACLAAWLTEVVGWRNSAAVATASSSGQPMATGGCPRGRSGRKFNGSSLKSHDCVPHLPHLITRRQPRQMCVCERRRGREKVKRTHTYKQVKLLHKMYLQVSLSCHGGSSKAARQVCVCWCVRNRRS